MPRELLVAKFSQAKSEGEARTKDLVFYTGASVARYDWWTGDEYMLSFSMTPADVKLDRLNTGAPLLDSHQNYTMANQVGVVDKAWIADGQAMATVRFSERPEVDGLWKDVSDGIVQNVSMGVSIGQLVETTKKGDKVKSYKAIDWEPMEISIVPVGADPGAGFLAAQNPLEVLKHEFDPTAVAAEILRWRREHQQNLAKSGAASTADEPAAEASRLLAERLPLARLASRLSR